MLDLNAIEQRAKFPADYYDAGLFGGEDAWSIERWHDYIRYELGRSEDFYRPDVDLLKQDCLALIARVRELEAADNEVSRAGVALAERVRTLERVVEAADALIVAANSHVNYTKLPDGSIGNCVLCGAIARYNAAKGLADGK